MQQGLGFKPPAAGFGGVVSEFPQLARCSIQILATALSKYAMPVFIPPAAADLWGLQGVSMWDQMRRECVSIMALKGVPSLDCSSSFRILGKSDAWHFRRDIGTAMSVASIVADVARIARGMHWFRT